MRKSIWPGCKHPETESSSILAKNGDDIAYLRCADPKCMTILEWQIVPKEKEATPVEKEAEPEASGRPKTTRPKPATEKVPKKPKAPKATVAKVVKEEEPVKEVAYDDQDDSVEPDSAPETPIIHSKTFVLKDIKADGENAVFVVETDKGKTFEVVKESTAEKAAGVVKAKAKYVDVTAIVVEYTAVDIDQIPMDGVFSQMVNITTK